MEIAWRWYDSKDPVGWNYARCVLVPAVVHVKVDLVHIHVTHAVCARAAARDPLLLGR